MTNDTPITITLTRIDLCNLALACTNAQQHAGDALGTSKWTLLHDTIMAEIIAADEAAQEAPQTVPAAEAEQQPTETENAPQAATQAAEDAEITAITYTTDDDPDPAPGLLIHRPGTTRGIIIGDGVMLPDDPADMLTAYGEREYSRDAAGNYIIPA